ncbi:subtilisin SUB7 [Cardiosporidium cionae]|uniref:subtilisin n=1 Tax=Cardiosporidium cionae TaxID=476202 RepID=A0ABQ7J7N7_9APIC|nr:subtilisin SUB7 [Cardiosporidium cionae]|eukprot:KAF8819994.1 subtilisin SUB7 [Cardiosporidium cionae]
MRGCNLGHPEFSNKIWVNPREICNDGIDNDGNGFVDDCHGWINILTFSWIDFVNDDNVVEPSSSGHGTASASIIAAASNNVIGISGICWGCVIMCLKFIGEGHGTVSDQVQAIDYAVRMGARISNNSYGGYG